MWGRAPVVRGLWGSVMAGGGGPWAVWLWGERPPLAQAPTGAAPCGGGGLYPKPSGSGAPSAAAVGKFGAALWPGFIQLSLLGPCPPCS